MSLIYDKEELESIAKKQESNNKMEEIINQLKEKWRKDMEPIIEDTRIIFKLDNAQKIINLQASALGFRLNINEEMSSFLQKLSKENVKLKRATQEKMIWYALGKSPLGLDKKLSNTQMTAIYDAHMAENQRAKEIIEGYIEFLRGLAKMLTDIGYQVKNIIEMYNAMQGKNM